MSEETHEVNIQDLKTGHILRFSLVDVPNGGEDLPIIFRSIADALDADQEAQKWYVPK